MGLRRPGAAVQTPNGPDPLIGALFALFLVPAVGGAQEAPALRAQHFTIGVGFVSSGAYDVGTAAAELRGNGPGASAPPFTLTAAEPVALPELLFASSVPLLIIVGPL